MELEEFEQEEVIEEEEKKEEREEKERKRKFPRKLLILFSALPFILLIFAIVAVVGIKSGREVKPKAVGMVPKQTPQQGTVATNPNQTPKPPKKTTLPRTPSRKIVKVTVEKNPFKEFYERKYLARVEEEVKKKILKEVQEKEKVERDRLLSELRKKLQMSSSAPRIDFRVKAIICSDRCYALTDKGVLGNGDLYKGKVLVVTPSGVSLK